MFSTFLYKFVHSLNITFSGWWFEKLYHILLYTAPWSSFELTTSVVIGIDCIGSCKSNYHMITATTAPKYNGKGHVITEILLKVALNTIKQVNPLYLNWRLTGNLPLEKNHYLNGVMKFKALELLQTNIKIRSSIPNLMRQLSNCSAISWGGQVNFQLDDDEVCFSWIFIVLTYWNNSRCGSRKEISRTEYSFERVCNSIRGRYRISSRLQTWNVARGR
jgi:hypothetical protein